MGSIILGLKQERIEADLIAREKELEESGVAINVLLIKIDQEKEELKQSITANLSESVHPYIEKLEKTELNSRQKSLLNILAANLKGVTSPFMVKISLQYANLTPTEITVAKLIREGRPSKVISDLLNLSVNTVLFHRSNIRKKLGLGNQKVNLRGYLASLEE